MNDKKMVWAVAVVLVVLGIFAFNRASCAQQKAEVKGQGETEQLKEQIARLNARIAQLEHQKNYEADAFDDDWDPFAQMNMMQRAMSRMMGPMMLSSAYDPHIDIKEAGNQYVITMDIPGMDKDNIEVKVENQNLIISGERKSETQEKDEGGKIYRHERSFGHFMRAIPLPKDAKTDLVDAQYTNGVLTIKVGREVKADKPAGQKIQVK